MTFDPKRTSKKNNESLVEWKLGQLDAVHKAQKELEARMVAATELYHDGKITRQEMFRLEMDAMIGKNTGDIKYEDNNDYQEYLKELELKFDTQGC